ncbi:MAG TPA: DNA topoisomerase IV subunit A [Pirellulaceae bacterium]|nr:DNA topoisomerase IV subunit A [Pirellulaceae bacterium]
MAKKKKATAADDAVAPPVQLKEKDKKTLAKLEGLAEQVVKQVETRKDPHLDIPSRALSNVKFVKTRGILEMGSNTNRRQLFNLSQAKSYMQTMLVGMGCSKLIQSDKSSSLRGLYYMLKHTIDSTKEETFNDQQESDVIIEDVEVLLNALREELHLYAENRGSMVGPIVISDMGDTIDCSRMGSGGYSIPSICEPERIQFLSCDAKFILHVEKGTVWQRFNEDKFWKKHNCLLTHGAGQPPRGVRRMLYRLHHELKLPIYCVLDNDPWGYYIYSVIKQGSINLAFESTRMAIPEAKFLGLRSIDSERCGLSPSVRIKLNDNDKKRAKQILKYPWFAGKPKWKKEIDKMLTNDFKLEVESLISKDISYVTETYVPERLEDEDWLD